MKGSAWSGGWFGPARRCPSPNFNARPRPVAVDLIVVHSISLPPRAYGGDAIERLFTNRLDCDAHPYYQTLRAMTVSAHFLIRRDGSWLQFVSCDERAWHAGRSVWRGREECNDFSVGIELEGLEGESFEAAQYDALATMTRALAGRYPVVDVAGHEHVAPGRKKDPGAAFDWAELRRQLHDLRLTFAA